MLSIIGEARDLLWRATREPLGFAGVTLATFSGVLLVALLLIALFGGPSNPYLGAVTFLILPALFILGLVLIPISHRRYCRRRACDVERPRFPVYDLNQPGVRNRLLLIGALTLVNVLVLSVVAYRGVDYMDSVAFCGGLCHPVMLPEYTVYQGSPHARVRCVDCHIGPGASWFVQSKLSGSRQVIAQLAHTWPTPIETPVHNLRPSRETCEQCHWPKKFVGDRLIDRVHFRPDSANTPLHTMLLMKVGGSAGVDSSRGIHWHVLNRVEYRSDEKREEIPWVRVTRTDGRVEEYASGEVPDSIASRPPRRMDCVDCHNRPTHIFRTPERALDEALAGGALPRDLPYLRREAQAALTADYADDAAARAGIARHLSGFYAREYPALADSGRIARAIAGTQAIRARYVFPEMHVDWGTYPDHIGHEESPGCFRCHDDAHATADGRTISQDCSLCHNLLSMEEEHPDIERTLYGGQ